MLVPPTPVRPGDKIAVVSPAWAAPAYFPDIHHSAMRRLEGLLDLNVVEYPSTAKLGASIEERARDLNAAFADPDIRAILTTVGGDDLIRLTPHLDSEAARADPKPFLGYSDNTNILNWLHGLGLESVHGGATQVHLGPSPTVDVEHLDSLRAALFRDRDLEYFGATYSEDYGFDWSDPRARSEEVERERATPLEFIGSDSQVRGRTWGGCMEVIDQLALADRLPPADALEGAILVLETSEILPPPDFVGRWVRALGERGYLEAASGLMFARPVTDDRDAPAPAHVREARREAYAQYVLSHAAPYADDLLVCLGLNFGHTKPQVLLPHGGEITLDPHTGSVRAHFTHPSQA